MVLYSDKSNVSCEARRANGAQTPATGGARGRRMARLLESLAVPPRPSLPPRHVTDLPVKISRMAARAVRRHAHRASRRQKSMLMWLYISTFAVDDPANTKVARHFYTLRI
ncbi:hypothetical protein O0L34_g68 [Tuta absoluta]|nr:hypothetical protein O0L34_g68 [Tuta absoluta]